MQAPTSVWIGIAGSNSYGWKVVEKTSMRKNLTSKRKTEEENQWHAQPPSLKGYAEEELENPMRW